MIYRFFIFVGILVISCTNATKKQQENQAEGINEKQNTNINHGIGEVLTPESRKLIDSWKEYEIVEGLMNEYYNISPTKATANAQELSNATLQLKDSIRIERFKEPDLKIRLHVLHNTALRLADMGEIARIDNQEIETEVDNLINAFTSITNKINNIVNQKSLEKELKGFN